RVKPCDKDLVSWPDLSTAPVDVADLVGEAERECLSRWGRTVLKSESSASDLSAASVPQRPCVDPILGSSPRACAGFAGELLQGGMISFRVARVDDPYSLGFFFVEKVCKGTLRPVFDARVANEGFAAPPKTTLPAAAARAALESDNLAALARGDIQRAFCHMLVPEGMEELFTLPHISSRLLNVKQLDGLPIPPDGLLRPMVRVPPMGWSWSLLFCRSIMGGALLHCGFGDGVLIEVGRPSPALSSKDGVAAAGYVDNFAIVGGGPVAVTSKRDEVTRALEAWGLPVHSLDAASAVSAFTGLEINGEPGAVRVKPRSAMRLRQALVAVSRRGAPDDSDIIEGFLDSSPAGFCKGFHEIPEELVQVSSWVTVISRRHWNPSKNIVEHDGDALRDANAALSDPARARHPCRALRALDWLGWRVLNFATASQLDCIPVCCLTDLPLGGFVTAAGGMTVAAMRHLLPLIPVGKRPPPRSVRTLDGGRRLMPPQSRLVLPRLVAVAVAGWLMWRNLPSMAVIVALVCHACLRPSEAYRLRVGSLMPPISGSGVNPRGIVGGEAKPGRPGMAGVMDESALGNAPELWPALRARMPNAFADASLWNFRPVVVRAMFRQALRELGLRQESLSVCALRRGGNSRDLLSGARAIAGVKQTWRWTSDTSLMRHGKRSGIQQRIRGLSPQIAEFGVLGFARLSVLIVSKLVKGRFPLPVPLQSAPALPWVEKRAPFLSRK
ncbi:unnamed protein product, partial [Prorocentrum cordatum]